MLDLGEERAENATVAPILVWGHENPVVLAATAALALDDLSVGHPATRGEDCER